MGPINMEEYTCLRWIDITRTRSSYELHTHEVFDDRDEGVEDIYDFSYFYPDDIYGRLIGSFSCLEDALKRAEELFGARRDKYLVYGYMNEAWSAFDKGAGNSGKM